jgi:hypothetical protein
VEQGEPAGQLLGGGGSPRGSVRGEAVEVGDGGGVTAAVVAHAERDPQRTERQLTGKGEEEVVAVA